MDVFQWEKEFETGSSEVDQQHQHLVMILNRFGAHVALNDLDAAAMEKVFEELANYTQYHFSAEEKIMVSVGVDPEVGKTSHSQSSALLFQHGEIARIGASLRAVGYKYL